MSHGIGPCLLCGSETAPRAMALVEWREPIGHETWSHVPRCVDRAACRATVELVLLEPWPVDDGTPAPARPVTVPPEPVAVAAEEVLPWNR